MFAFKTAENVFAAANASELKSEGIFERYDFQKAIVSSSPGGRAPYFPIT